MGTISFHFTSEETETQRGYHFAEGNTAGRWSDSAVPPRPRPPAAPVLQLSSHSLLGTLAVGHFTFLVLPPSEALNN